MTALEATLWHLLQMLLLSAAAEVAAVNQGGFRITHIPLAK